MKRTIGMRGKIYTLVSERGALKDIRYRVYEGPHLIVLGEAATLSEGLKEAKEALRELREVNR